MIRNDAGLEFILVLHVHLPHVMRHERWPHGSDWLMEAAADSYLPLIGAIESLEREGIASRVTINVTPVVGAQLRDPLFGNELRRFLDQRLEACTADERDLETKGDAELLGVVRYWRMWYESRRAQFERMDGDIVGALGRLQRSGQIELISSGATHGFLPLLARDESIQLQLLAGRAEHERLFGVSPTGCWLPECAYRPRGRWAPLPEVTPRMRAGIETHLEAAGYRFIVVDSHLAQAGEPLDAYGARSRRREHHVDRSPYGNYMVGARRDAVRALVRDPVATRQVWSRDGGYPGSAPYLEFHKLRFPGGLQLWSVTGPGVSLGDKRAYDPRVATAEARHHARHFADLLEGVARGDHPKDGVIVAPFDAELFGHWWFEGPEFLAEMYRALDSRTLVRPVTASAHVARTSATPLDLPAGSWGRDGDFSFWLNDKTAWMWRRLWALEERFWNAASRGLSRTEAGPILEQAARSLLLAQSSDWEFMISAGEVPDYGEKRFTTHVADAEALVDALETGAAPDAVGRLMDALAARDAVFPNVLDVVAKVVKTRAAAA